MRKILQQDKVTENISFIHGSLQDIAIEVIMTKGCNGLFDKKYRIKHCDNLIERLQYLRDYIDYHFPNEKRSK